MSPFPIGPYSTPRLGQNKPRQRYVAARINNVGAAEILIKDGAKVMPKNRLGKTPLDYAESAAMIRLLKENGAIER